MNMAHITQEHLKHMLTYNEKTGVFTRNISRGGKSKGSVAGTPCKHTGYIQIGIAYRHYYAHQLAWLYMTGEWPILEVDHINTVRSDNSINNLRLVSRSQNAMNSNKHRDNTSGYKGVHWLDICKKWRSEICLNGRRYNLGMFVSKELAAQAYAKAAAQLHGDFARVS